MATRAVSAGPGASTDAIGTACGPPMRTTGVSQELGPLNSYSRRIVHMEVSRFDDVASESQGDGQLKHVTISLRKPAR